MLGLPYVEREGAESPGSFRLAGSGQVADIYVFADDHTGVVRAARDLQADVGRVTGIVPALKLDGAALSSHAVIVGTIGRNPVIDRLIGEGKLDADGVVGKWESFVIQTVPDPLPGVELGLVIAGSDKRGTIFGIYDVSENIGVSPWYWWADVIPQRREMLTIRPGVYKQGEPSVKYRGIFLNDEGPSLMSWVRANFRDFTHEFYEKVFELMLRLKANYLWPAMWDNTFYEDDELNPAVADMYGIVIGTSHHEPMLRPHGDWKKHRQGPWDYAVNRDVLYRFWEEGIRRSRPYESIVTLGMRGDGDEPMGGHLSFREKIELLQTIVRDQREIIARHLNPDVTKVPQLWALYKEVQEYYEHGMRVPEDITLLWSDDNHGNLRRVPAADERHRSGGAGIYYHLDYVGGPRSYKWINTVPLPKIWEQMHKAYEYGADRIWIVNVGDLKPMELPMEFFLRMAWNVRAFTPETIGSFSRWWAERQFGLRHAEEIAYLLDRYVKFNGRVKPELLNAVELYSSVHYKEADNVIAELRTIVRQAERLYGELPERLKDAFFQLVLHPVKATAVVNELHLRAERSRLYARQGRVAANAEAVLAQQLFALDDELSFDYNKRLAMGKWNHMMDQTHIGYTYWNQPPRNEMPEVGRVEPLDEAAMGIAVEGSEDAWPDCGRPCRLPAFDGFSRERRFIDVFNRGLRPFTFTARVSADWIRLSQTEGRVVMQRRLWVDIDWNRAPRGDRVTGAIIVSGSCGTEVTVHVEAFHPEAPAREALDGFIETNGCIAIEAAHYTARHDAGGAGWREIPDYGRTLSSMAVFPVTLPATSPPANSPRLEYRVYIVHPGELKVTAYVAPSLDFVPGQGLRLGVSFDDQPVQVADAVQRTERGEFHLHDWEQSVIYNIRKIETVHRVTEPGYHTLKIWMVDPIVVLQKIVIDCGGVRPSFLGPPESPRGGKETRRHPAEGWNPLAPFPAAGEDDPLSPLNDFDPFPVPGEIVLPERVLREGDTAKLDVLVARDGLYELRMAAGKADNGGASPSHACGDYAVRVEVVGRAAADDPVLSPHSEIGPCGCCRLWLAAGGHRLRLHVVRGALRPRELRFETVEADVFRVRPSLRGDGPSTDRPLVAQIGLFNLDTVSHRFTLTVSLEDDKGRPIGSASCTGILPRQDKEMYQFAFPAAGAGTRRCRLRVDVARERFVRTFTFDLPLPTNE